MTSAASALPPSRTQASSPHADYPIEEDAMVESRSEAVPIEHRGTDEESSKLSGEGAEEAGGGGDYDGTDLHECSSDETSIQEEADENSGEETLGYDESDGEDDSDEGETEDDYTDEGDDEIGIDDATTFVDDTVGDPTHVDSTATRGRRTGSKDSSVSKHGAGLNKRAPASETPDARPPAGENVITYLRVCLQRLRSFRKRLCQRREPANAANDPADVATRAGQVENPAPARRCCRCGCRCCCLWFVFVILGFIGGLYLIDLWVAEEAEEQEAAEMQEALDALGSLTKDLFETIATMGSTVQSLNAGNTAVRVLTLQNGRLSSGDDDSITVSMAKGEMDLMRADEEAVKKACETRSHGERAAMPVDRRSFQRQNISEVAWRSDLTRSWHGRRRATDSDSEEEDRTLIGEREPSTWPAGFSLHAPPSSRTFRDPRNQIATREGTKARDAENLSAVNALAEQVESVAVEQVKAPKIIRSRHELQDAEQPARIPNVPSPPVPESTAKEPPIRRREDAATPGVATTTSSSVPRSNRSTQERAQTAGGDRSTATASSLRETSSDTKPSDPVSTTFATTRRTLREIFFPADPNPQRLGGLLFPGLTFVTAEPVEDSNLGGGEDGEHLGDGTETFFENGVDKSPIRGDVKGGLADDQSFEPPKFADAFYNDPACEKAGDMWTTYRRQMSVVHDIAVEDEDQKALVSMNFLVDTGMTNTTYMDEQANRCFIGVATMLFHLARHRMTVEGVYTSAAYLFRSLDHYMSSIHPDKFDEQNENSKGPGKRLWPVSDHEVTLLKAEIAKRSSGRGWDLGPKNKDQKPYHGNLFGAMADDLIDRDANKTLKNAFKVYVYNIDEYDELKTLTKGAAFCKDNQWGFEVQLHFWFLACDCRTDNPEEADFFFVPQYTACHLNLETFSEEESNSMFESLVPKLKHFRRTEGRDHVFVWGAGFSVDGPFRNWRKYIKDSIFLMAETEYWNPYHWQTEKPFNFAKDIVLPGRIQVSEIAQHNEHAMPMEERPWVGDFVGWNRPLHAAQGNQTVSPRQALLRWAKRYPAEMHIRQDVPYSEALRGSISSRFCFVPRGKSAWSSRLFRVLYGKCVPVLLNDDYEVPFVSLFENKDNWFIRWPMREANRDLAHFLFNFDIEVLKQMVKNAIEPKCWYVWIPSTLDTGHVELQEGEMNSVCPQWRTQNAFFATHTLLYHKKRVTKSSSKTFFMPDPKTGEVVYVDDNFERI
ncbi:unnamed protein product [Amoebophrya sp. A25]|nr:unnamed protein product [Amoebophrya sp. A25]|eukprot:GSA25T00005138001.1